MFSVSDFWPIHFKYIQKLAVAFMLVLMTLNTTALAQNTPDKGLCRLYEQELRKIDEPNSLRPQQTARYNQLIQMQMQAKTDAKRYLCDQETYSNRSHSEACQYINTAQKKIDSALSEITRQPTKTQKARMRQDIYMKLRQNNCPTAQDLEQSIQKSPQALQPAANTKSLNRTSLEDGTSAHTKQAITAIKPAIANYSSSFSIWTTPNMNNTKAAEPIPPLVSKAVDYVSDPKIRRVGPAYLYDQ